MRLSWPMQRALKNLHDKRPASSHCRKQSDYGGLHATMFALLRRGLIDSEYQLTKLGRAEAAKLK